MGERKKTLSRSEWVLLLFTLAGISLPVGTAVFKWYSEWKNSKLADDLHPELEAIAEQPIRCRGGWLGIQIVIVKSDFERVFATVLAMVEAGKIDCEVNIISTDHSVNTYIDPTGRPMVYGDLPSGK